MKNKKSRIYLIRGPSLFVYGAPIIKATKQKKWFFRGDGSRPYHHLSISCKFQNVDDDIHMTHQYTLLVYVSMLAGLCFHYSSKILITRGNELVYIQNTTFKFTSFKPFLTKVYQKKAQCCFEIIFILCAQQNCFNFTDAYI